MIVKIAHPKAKDSFSRLSGYITQLTKINGVERADSFSRLTSYMAREQFVPLATNCGVDPTDIDAALKVIEHTQNQNTRAKKKSLHLIVSFPEGERPSEAILADIEKELVGVLEMHECQRIRVVHDDTDFLHMHIAVNVIHPRTHVSVQTTGDYKLLQAKAHELEVKYGLSHCEEREMRLADPEHRKAASFEREDHYRGELSFKTWMKERREEILSAAELANNWGEFQSKLAMFGVEAVRFRNGLVFKNSHGRGVIKASELDRTLSKPSLERRWGIMPASLENERQEREEVPIQPAEVFTRQPIYASDERLFQVYLDEFREQLKAKREYNRATQTKISRRYAALKRRYRRRASSIRYSAFLNGAQKRRAYRRLFKDRERAYRELRQASRDAKNRFKALPAYRPWLIDRARNGDDIALVELRGISQRLNEKQPWKSIVQGAVTSQTIKAADRTKNRKVYRDGTLEVKIGDVTLLDDGKRIHTPSSDMNEIRAMLELAMQRYQGPLDIRGTDKFLQNVLVAAIGIEGLAFKSRSMQKELVMLQRDTKREVKQQRELMIREQ